MNSKVSELYYEEGKSFFYKGLYQEALEAFEKALEIKSDPRYYYRKAVVYQRLNQPILAEKSLQQALDCLSGLTNSKHKKRMVKLYHDDLNNIHKRDKPIIWWEWWLSKRHPLRFVLGIILALILAILVFLPLVIVPLCIFVNWLCVDQINKWGTWWIWYITPIIILAIILLSPGMRRISAQGFEIDADMLQREEDSLELFEKPEEQYVTEEYYKSP